MVSKQWSDGNVEEMIAHLLRAGVMLAAGIVLTGGIFYLIRYGRQPTDYKVFHGVPTELQSVSGIIHFAFSGHFRGIIQLGLLLLIATPIVRVIFAVFAFALRRDKMYVVITLIVLFTLCYSLIGAG